MMQSLPKTERILKAVALRLYWAKVGSRTKAIFFGLALTYAVLLLTSRGLGYYANVWSWWQVLALGTVSALLSLAIVRRPDLTQAARAVDRHSQTRDLFLTAMKIEQSAGAFQPLVLNNAEQAAERVRPSQVVTFRWEWPCEQVATAVAAMLLAVSFFPQFDPFGVVKEAQAAMEKKEQFIAARKQTEDRLAELTQAEEQAEEKEEVEKALEELKLTLGKLQPGKIPDNRRLLNREQDKLGQLWKDFSARQLQEIASRSQLGGSLSGEMNQSLTRWGEDLKMGKTGELELKLEGLKSKLQKLRKTTDPAEQEELLSEIRKEVLELKDFADLKTESKPLKQALERALMQLDSAKDKELADQQAALEAAMRSLELSKKELQRMGLNAEELKKLEEALTTLQEAKELNEQDRLDEEATGEFASLDDYRAMYEEMMGEMAGEDMGGEGSGDPLPEDESVKTKFKSEVAKSAIKAGKTLFEMKSKGLGSKGEVEQNYRTLIQDVQQGVSEAIMQEQVPPGYHDGIREYFNSLDKSAPALPTK